MITNDIEKAELKEWQTGEEIVINGMAFIVRLANTAETSEANGRKNVAAEMRKNGEFQGGYATRKTGRKLFLIWQLADVRTFSKQTSMMF